MRTNVVRGFGVAAAAAALLLSSSACGGAAESSGTKGSKGSDASAPGASAGKALTGTRLKGLLIPAAEMPEGFTESRDGAKDSGGTDVEVADAPIAADKVCAALSSTSWIRVARIAPVSFAQNDFVKGDEQIAQEIDVYKGDDATKVMAALKKVFAQCKTYTDTGDAQAGPAKMKLVQSALPTRSGTGLKAVLTSPTYEGGMTLAAIQVGDAVVTTFYSSTAKSKGAAAALMAKKVAEKVKAAKG